MEISKSAAIFHGLLYLCSSSGRIFPLKFFTSYTPAKITDRNVGYISRSIYWARSCARKSKNTWLFDALSTSSIIRTIGLSETAQISPSCSKSAFNAKKSFCEATLFSSCAIASFNCSVLLTGFLFNDLKKEFAKEREKIVSV